MSTKKEALVSINTPWVSPPLSAILTQPVKETVLKAMLEENLPNVTLASVKYLFLR